MTSFWCLACGESYTGGERCPTCDFHWPDPICLGCGRQIDLAASRTETLGARYVHASLNCQAQATLVCALAHGQEAHIV